MEARKEMESEAANVIGKIDPYREIEILPPGMVNGNTLRRTSRREERRGLHRRDMRARG